MPKSFGWGYDDFDSGDEIDEPGLLDSFVPATLEIIPEEDEPDEDAEWEEQGAGSPPRPQPEWVGKKGWLRLSVNKKGKTFRPSKSRWKEKWCELDRDGRLHFRASPNVEVNTAEAKVVDMALIVDVLEDKTGEHPEQFVMRSLSQTYFILTKSARDTTGWIKALLVAQQTSRTKIDTIRRNQSA